jgi:hypothetical protein
MMWNIGRTHFQAHFIHPHITGHSAFLIMYPYVVKKNGAQCIHIVLYPEEDDAYEMLLLTCSEQNDGTLVVCLALEDDSQGLLPDDLVPFAKAAYHAVVVQHATRRKWATKHPIPEESVRALLSEHGDKLVRTERKTIATPACAAEVATASDAVADVEPAGSSDVDPIISPAPPKRPKTAPTSQEARIHAFKVWVGSRYGQLDVVGDVTTNAFREAAVNVYYAIDRAVLVRHDDEGGEAFVETALSLGERVRSAAAEADRLAREVPSAVAEADARLQHSIRARMNLLPVVDAGDVAGL